MENKSENICKYQTNPVSKYFAKRIQEQCLETDDNHPANKTTSNKDEVTLNRIQKRITSKTLMVI